MDDYTTNLINKNSPFAQQEGRQDAYTFDGRLLDTGVNSSNFRPAGSNQNIQFNDSGTLAGNASLLFNKTQRQFGLGDVSNAAGWTGRSINIRAESTDTAAGYGILEGTDANLGVSFYWNSNGTSAGYGAFDTNGYLSPLRINASEILIQTDAGGGIVLGGSTYVTSGIGNNRGYLNVEALTAARTFTFPNTSGTFLFKGAIAAADIPGSTIAGTHIAVNAITNAKINDYDLAKGTGNSLSVTNTGTAGTWNATSQFARGTSLGFTGTIALLGLNDIIVHGGIIIGTD